MKTSHEHDLALYLETQRAALVTPSVVQARALLLKRFWPEHQLSSAYHALLCTVVGLQPLPSLKPLLLPNGAPLIEEKGYLDSGKIPSLALAAETALVWAVLGHLQNREDLCLASLKVANWLLHLLDHRGLPLTTLWAEATGFSTLKLVALFEALFSIAYEMTHHSFFEQAFLLQKRSLSENQRPLFIAHLMTLLPADKKQYPYELIKVAEEATLGMIKFSKKETTVAFVLTGWNSGMGRLQKKEIGVVNFGPQVGPLDDLSRFGIARKCLKNFQDLVWEKEPDGALIKGWTQMYALPYSFEATLAYLAGNLKIKLFLDEVAPKRGLNFVFYVQAQEAQIQGKKQLSQGTLDRYSGSPLPVIFSKGEETLLLEPHQEQGVMEVIPLGGGDEFWGANFLVSFSMEQGVTKFSIE